MVTAEFSCQNAVARPYACPVNATSCARTRGSVRHRRSQACDALTSQAARIVPRSPRRMQGTQLAVIASSVQMCPDLWCPRHTPS